MTIAELIATGALITSVCSIFIAVIEGVRGRKHQRLSVKPTLDVDMHIYRETKRIGYTVTNRGLGPAYIKVFNVSVDGEKIESTIEEYWNTVIAKLGLTDWNAKFFTPTSRSVISPGDNRELLNMEISVDGIDLYGLAKRIDIFIEYESAYKEKLQCGMSRDMVHESV